jgi:general secretion pathway protein K
MAAVPRRAPGERGVALVLVLWVIMVLSLLIAGFAFTMHVETQVVSFNRKQVKAEMLARSGIEIAKWMLVEAEKSATNLGVTALNQTWATNVEWYVDHELGEGKFNVQVFDEQSKLPINRMSEGQLRQVMELLQVEASDSDVIVDSIVDWIDENDLHQLNGAESDYYESLTPPYRAKNGPMDRVEELLLVRGVTPELFFGLPAEGDEPARPGLKDIFTTYTTGQVNVNTASRIELQSLLGLDDVQVQSLLAHRDGIDGIPGTDDDQPFRAASEALGMVNVTDPKVRQQMQQMTTVKSSFFVIKSTGEVGGVKRTITAVVRRQGDQIAIASWNEKPAGT